MCKHKWNDPTVNYTPPPNLTTEQIAKIVDDEGVFPAQRVMFGISTVRQECEKCGMSQSSVVIGDARHPQPYVDLAKELGW